MKTSRDAEKGCHAFDREIDELFGDRKINLSLKARRHMDECKRCSALYEWSVGGGTGDLPSARVSGQIEAQIQARLIANLKPVAPRISLTAITFRFALAFVVLAATAVGFMGPAGARAMTNWQWMEASLPLLIGVSLLSVSLAWQIVPGSLHRLRANIVIGIAAASLVAGSLLLFPWDTAVSSVRQGLECLGAGLLLAAPAAVALLLLAHRGAAMDRIVFGATIGATSGLLGVSALQFHCPILEASHIVTWHVGALVISLVAGTAIGYATTYFQQRPRVA